MDDHSKQKRPTYSDEFKQNAVRLVVDEGYSFKAAWDDDYRLKVLFGA